MLGKGVRLSALYFDAWPFADREQADKVRQLTGQLSQHFSTDITLYSISHKDNLTEIGRCCERRMGCVLCRRIMLRIASEFGSRNGMDFLVTGESLGQVASQTLSNIRSENPASHLFILRPLIGLDKIEIEEKARQFGTYDISIRPGSCCTMAPKYPVTNADVNMADRQEYRLNLSFLIERAIETAKIIK